jgi:hypothetical protein
MHTPQPPELELDEDAVLPELDEEAEVVVAVDELDELTELPDDRPVELVDDDAVLPALELTDVVPVVPRLDRAEPWLVSDARPVVDAAAASCRRPASTPPSPTVSTLPLQPMSAVAPSHKAKSILMRGGYAVA